MSGLFTEHGPLVGWMIETGFVVSLLIAIILIIRRPFARWFGANAAYGLWSLPLIRLCLPVVAIPESWVPAAFRSAVDVDVSAAPIPNFPALVDAPIGGDLSPFLDAPASVQGDEFSILMLVLGLWISVALLWLASQLYQQRQFKARLSAESVAPSAALLDEINTAAARTALSKAPQVRVSQQNIGPLITGVFKPLVILPHGFEDDFDLQQRNFALIHEFAHLKRKDLWVACGVLIFRAINWPNPLVHFASHRLRADQEAACDAYVVKLMGQGTAHSYAETLVKAAKHTSGALGRAGQLALSLTDDDTQISKGDER